MGALLRLLNSAQEFKEFKRLVNSAQISAQEGGNFNPNLNLNLSSKGLSPAETDFVRGAAVSVLQELSGALSLAAAGGGGGLGFDWAAGGAGGAGGARESGHGANADTTATTNTNATPPDPLS